MSQIKRTIVLQDIRNYGYVDDHFHIQSVINSTEYQVGKCINTETADKLISEGWTVKLVQVK